MSFRHELKIEAAAAALEVAKSLGVEVTYQDRAIDEIHKLWVIPEKQDMAMSQDGSLYEEHTARKFYIPRQEHFPPESGPSINAVIMYEGWDWSVDKWEADSVSACYTATTTHHKPRRVAIR